MLLLLPIDKKIDWRNPPVITILIVLVNCFIYFAMQSGDNERMQAAAKYYFSTDLPSIEFPEFADYLQRRGERSEALAVREVLQDSSEDLSVEKAWILSYMMSKNGFMNELDRFEIITTRHIRYNYWRSKHDRFVELSDRVVVNRYSLNREDAFTYLSSTFLHGSIDHLLGNMLFLFIVGFVVERILGHTQFLISYLIVGILGNVLWAIFHVDAGVIGASGAVSGVMGLYAVLYGMRKIRFFYWIVFYFDYVRAPALILLPIWVLKEFYYLYIGEGQVAYLVHIGGFIAGAAVAYVHTRVLHRVNLDFLDADNKDEKRRAVYEEGLGYVAALDFTKAKRAFKAMLRDYPDDREVIAQLYKVSKTEPQSEDYHQVARRILTDDRLRTQTEVPWVHDTFTDYSRNAKPGIRLSPQELTGLAQAFAQNGLVDSAERILTYLIKNYPKLEELPTIMYSLSRAFQSTDKHEKYQKYTKLLTDLYPQSKAAQQAKQGFRA